MSEYLRLNNDIYDGLRLRKINKVTLTMLINVVITVSTNMLSFVNHQTLIKNSVF